MIIGFGFGSPLVALLMLLVTGFISYNIYKYLKNRKTNYSAWEENQDWEEYKNSRREYYYRQRQKARQMMDKYNLSDEEIEEVIEKEFRNNNF
jgi:heme-degrading monooxygenase HmoA